MKTCKRHLTALLALALCAGILTLPAAAVDRSTLDTAISDAGHFLYSTVKNPQVGSIGGEWAVMGLARSGYDVPESYYQDYLATVEEYVAACGGALHDKKYTEYSRVIIALSSLGRDARDVAGHDLTKPLGDYEKTIWQGLNGPIWALLALDSRDYPMPRNPEARTQATRQMYIERILDCQNPDGGWSLLGGTSAASVGDGVSDPDITGMALQALAKYQDQTAVAKATQEALACMSGRQDGDGGYSSWGAKNSESCVQMLVALCELGIPLDDPRFVKNGKSLLDNLLTFRTEGGGFLHTIPASGSDQMASEQAFYALTAAVRMWDGQNSLYRMGDAAAIPDGAGSRPKKGSGLEGKHADVSAAPITAPGLTFEDISGHKNQPAIEALAARGMINGKSGGGFDPDGSMTRSEFASLVVKALGLPARTAGSFSDVAPGDWYADVVGTANAYGIVNGSGGKFLPLGVITRQEAAVMVMNAARLCGLDIAVGARILTQFTDRVDAAQWARPALAFCYEQGILDQSDVRIRPTENAARGEVAQMLFNLLSSANLL